MKITMYELLGMIKDGKAPKKIKYFNKVYEYDHETMNYAHFLIDHYDWLLGEDITAMLDDTITILEEKKKIPEKIPLNYADDRKPEEVYEYLRCSYNQLIDYLNSIGK